jgi:hypothetical protein
MQVRRSPAAVANGSRQDRMAKLKAVHKTSRSDSHFASCEKIEKIVDKRHITMQSGML